MPFAPLLVLVGLGIGAMMVFGGEGSPPQAQPLRQIPPAPPDFKTASPPRTSSPRTRTTASPPPVDLGPPEGVPEDAPGLFDSLYELGQSFYDWLMGDTRESSRIDDVMTCFEETKDVTYSYGGGHPPKNTTWPLGSTGRRGAKGWDCSGWILAVARRASPVPVWANVDLGATGIWKRVGSPRNGMDGAQPGNLVFFGNAKGEIKHVGFLTGTDSAVSAFGQGSKTNGDQPNQKVKAHTLAATGLRVIGNANW
jgi:cell wall-associated NlpC family hydrolase